MSTRTICSLVVAFGIGLLACAADAPEESEGETSADSSDETSADSSDETFVADDNEVGQTSDAVKKAKKKSGSRQCTAAGRVLADAGCHDRGKGQVNTCVEAGGVRAYTCKPVKRSRLWPF